MDDKKGKKKTCVNATGSSSERETGKDPLEIAYGPTIGTHPEITKDDFEVDTDSGLHKPQNETAESGNQGERSDQQEAGEDQGENETDRRNSTPHYGLDGEGEFRNVWGR